MNKGGVTESFREQAMTAADPLNVCETALGETERKVRSLLELGQLIGLDLQLDEMLVQIAKKAAELMEAERYTLFLYDEKTDELWTVVPVESEVKQFRMPSHKGVAGYCFQTGETVNVGDASDDELPHRPIDLVTGRPIGTLLCMPVKGRSGRPLGVIELINKKTGVFTEEDALFLRTFNNHTAVFVELAQLQKARIAALERAQEELEQVNRAKGKALDHLAHELSTPISVIRGVVSILKRRASEKDTSEGTERFFEMLDKQLNRLTEIQQETGKIIRTYHAIEGNYLVAELDRLWRRIGEETFRPARIEACWSGVKEFVVSHLPNHPVSAAPVPLLAFVRKALQSVNAQASRREVRIDVEGESDVPVCVDPQVLQDLVTGLVKNGIENTPDEGLIRISVEETNGSVVLKVQDFGVGITEENRPHVLEGLFHTQNTDLYGSGRPYEFNAGGKGLDLLLMSIYGARFGFTISVDSSRCIYIPGDGDLCPGRISLCSHCNSLEDCVASGGSIFSVIFAIAQENKPDINVESGAPKLPLGSKEQS